MPGLKYLVENGLSLDDIKDELHVLHMQRKIDSVKILKYRVEILKIDPSLPFKDGSIALHFAAGNESLNALRYLIEVGTDIES